MSDWTALCRVDEVPNEGGKYVVIGQRAVAVFRLPDGEVRVIDDACPHAGSSLSAGHYDAQNNCVLCAWHAWPFDLDTGRCPDNPAIGVTRYRARVVDGVVEAEL